MSILQFDARTVAPQVSLEPIPQGWYKVVVAKSNIKATSKGDGGLLELICQVIEGQYQGRLLYYNLNLFNPSQQAVDIAYKQLSALCHVVGQYQVQDQAAPDNATPMLHNIPFFANVVIAQGNRGPINNIVGLKDVNGNEPGKQGMGAQAAPGGFAPTAPAPQGWAAPGGMAPPQGGPAPGPAPQQWQAPAAAPGPAPGPAPGGWTTAPSNAPAAPPPAGPPPQQQQAWTPGQNQQPQPGQFQAPAGQPQHGGYQPPPPGPGGAAPNAPWSR